MAADIIRTDWPHLISHSNQISAMYRDDDSICSASNTALVIALAECGDLEKASGQADVFFRKYSNTNDIYAQRRSALILMYKSMVDYAIDRDREREVSTLRSLVASFETSDQEIANLVEIAARRMGQ